MFSNHLKNDIIKKTITKGDINMNRFRYTQQILKENVPYITDFIKRTHTYESGFYHITEYSSLVEKIMNIGKLGFIDFELQEFEDSKIDLHVITTNNKIKMDTNTYTRFKDICKFIQRESKSMLILINKLLPDQKENSITIGLPQYKEYFNVVDFFKKIKTITELIYHEESEEDIEIQNFDSGSLWIELAFNGAASLTFFGGIVTLASNMFTKYQEHRVTNKQIELVMSNAEQLADIKKQLNDKFLSEIQNEATLFLDARGEPHTPEQITSITKAIVMLDELIDLGTTFQPAYNALDNVKEEFPTIQNLLDLPTKGGKQLTNPHSLTHNDNNNSSDTDGTETD